MADITVASFTNALKVIYPQKRVESLFYSQHPFAAMLNKKDDFYGVNDALKITVQYGVPSGGRAVAFATAQANRSAGNEVRFALTRQSDYQVARLENEVIDAASRDIGTLIEVLKNKMDGAMKNLSRQYAAMLFGNGGGARGQVASFETDAVANDTVVLTNPDDVVFFERDMTMYGDTNDGTGASGSRSTDAFVIKVNRSTGRVTFSATMGGSGVDLTGIGWAANDYIFQDGDFGAVITGLQGWIPVSAPTATAFFGVDRTVDTDRLGGVRYDGTSDPIEEAVKKLAVRLVRNGGRPGIMFLNPIDFNTLELSLSTRVRYDNVKAPTRARIGFTGIVITTAAGEVRCIADLNCPRGYAWMLQMDTWTFHCLKGVPHQIMVNGGKLMTIEASDDVEFRQVYRGNLGNTAPGYNGVVQLAT
jgi:hypothetical protein